MTGLLRSQLASELQAERSARINMSRELAECKERFRLLTIVSDIATWDWDLVTGQVHRNQVVVGWFGDNRPIDNPTIEWWQRHIHPDDKKRVIDGFAEAIAGKQKNFAVEYRFRKADLTYAHLSDRSFIIRDENQIAVRAAGTIMDLTAAVVAKDKLAQAEAALVYSARYSAMGTMASMIAHELNQPLASITNYVRAGRRIAAISEDPALEKVESSLRAAEENALRAGGIVRRLRELVRRGQVDSRPTAIKTLIDEACTIALIDSEISHVCYDVHIADGTPTVLVDAIQIQQVLINLIRNSVEAFEQLNDRYITISAYEAGHFVELSVADNGPGIQYEIAQDLFGLRASHKASGMGIGLSICQTIVEAHGGKIWLAESDAGTDFRFTLPVVEDSLDLSTSQLTEIKHSLRNSA